MGDQWEDERRDRPEYLLPLLPIMLPRAVAPTTRPLLLSVQSLWAPGALFSPFPSTLLLVMASHC